MLNFLKRLKLLFVWITVEPVQFLHCLMMTTSNVVRDNLFIEKACRLDFNYTSEVCYNFTHKGFVEDSVKQNVHGRVAELDLWDGIIVSLPSAALCLFVGDWSDFHGRLPLLTIPVIGNILSYLAYMTNYYFFYELNTGHLLWGSILGVFGSYQCFNIGLYGYVSDVTDKENRTTRHSILTGLCSLGFLIGSLLGSRLFEITGVDNYYIIFGISCGIGIVQIGYVILFITESRVTSKEEKKTHPLLDLNSAKECLMSAFRYRPNNDRTNIMILLVGFAFIVFCFSTPRYDYLLLQLKYDWSIVEYTNYLTVERASRLVSLFLLLPFFSRYLHVSDSPIACVCALSAVIAYLLMALGNKDWKGPSGSWPVGWIMYLVAAFQQEPIILVIIRSQCTKYVQKEEIGRILAMTALVRALVPLAANPLFALMYKATIATFAGAYLLVVDAMLVLSLMGSMYLFWEERKRKKSEVEDHTP